MPLPGQELLLLPDPVDVLNHVPLNDNPLPPQPNLVLEATKLSKSPSSLEDLCVRAYLKYLENEVVTYVSLTQSKSHLVKGVAKRMLQVSSVSNFYFITSRSFQAQNVSYLSFLK